MLSRLLPICRRLSCLAPALVVLAVGAGFMAWDCAFSGSGGAAARPALPGKSYYVMVPLVELAAARPDGAAWDRAPGAAPDIYAEILWKGEPVYRSAVRKDGFLAKWSTQEIDLREVAVTGARVSLEDTIQAARISVREGEEIEVRVYDRDRLSRDDPAGVITIPTTALVEGDTAHARPADGLVRLTLRVVDMESPPEELQ